MLFPNRGTDVEKRAQWENETVGGGDTLMDDGLDICIFLAVALDPLLGMGHLQEARFLWIAHSRLSQISVESRRGPWSPVIWRTGMLISWT